MDALAGTVFLVLIPVRTGAFPNHINPSSAWAVVDFFGQQVPPKGRVMKNNRGQNERDFHLRICDHKTGTRRCNMAVRPQHKLDIQLRKIVDPEGAVGNGKQEEAETPTTPCSGGGNDARLLQTGL